MCTTINIAVKIATQQPYTCTYERILDFVAPRFELANSKNLQTLPRARGGPVHRIVIALAVSHLYTTYDSQANSDKLRGIYEPHRREGRGTSRGYIDYQACLHRQET